MTQDTRWPGPYLSQVRMAIPSCHSDIRVFTSRAIIRTGIWGEVLEIQRTGGEHARKIRSASPIGVWEQFLRVREGRLPNPSPPEVGLRMAQLWDAVRESAARGGAVITNPAPTYEPEPLTITFVAQGSHGIVAISADGHSVTYDPVGLVTGPDQFLYSITDGNGGVVSAMVYVNVDKDPTPPVVSTPVVGPERPLEGSKVRLTVTWTAEDPESGVKSSQLQFRRDGGDWSDVKLSALTARQASLLVTPGHSYQFRVRATNGASPGATSGYSLGGMVAI